MGFGRQLFYAGSCLFELTKGVILVAVIVVLIHLFVATIFIVDGVSMEPNFHSGQVVVVNRWDYLFGEPERGQVVVLRFPGDPEHRKFIKRIIGLPGETVTLEDGKVAVNGQVLPEVYLPPTLITPEMVPGKNRWVLGTDDYLAFGDNRPNSNDSRTFDEVNKRFLIGKAVFIIWPPNTTGLVPEATY